MAFHIGQKVICVLDATPIPECPFPIFKKNAVYTIARFDEEDGDTYIAVAELHPLVTGLISGFRPIVERKTDISIFTALLTPSKVDA